MQFPDTHTLIVTTQPKPYAAGVRYIRPLASVSGLRVCDVVVAGDVDRTPEVEQWLTNSVQTRVRGSCPHATS